MNQTWRKCPEMDEQQWLDWRNQGIGSSDAPAILGISPWTTPFQKWEEKVFPVRKESNSAMERGKALEEPARQEFERLMNCSVFPLNVENTKDSWLRASLDGISMKGDILVEIKCPNKDDHLSAINKKVPEKYYPQCQHQLAVTGLQGMYYYSFDGKKGAVVEVARDKEYIEKELFPKEKQFWNMVLDRIPPELVEKDFINLENHAVWKEASEKWKGAKRALQDAEFIENLHRDQLIALSKGRNAMGNNVKLTKSIVQGRIDYTKAIEDYIDNMRSHYPQVHFKPVPLDPYRKDSFVKWSLRAMD